MSLDHLCATCRAARVHACRASDHSGEPAASSGVSFLSPSPHSAVGADGGAPAFHADPLTRLCLQMEAPRQSLHRPLRRLCSQMEAPPQSLHELLCRLCSQMEGPSLAFGAVPEIGLVLFISFLSPQLSMLVSVQSAVPRANFDTMMMFARQVPGHPCALRGPCLLHRDSVSGPHAA